MAADLLVDAGDFMTGNPVCNLREDGVPGAAMARLLNALDYDVGLVGNHEFDIGFADLKLLLPRFEHPVLAADIVDLRRASPSSAPIPSCSSAAACAWASWGSPAAR